jgi:hypothetical protein
MYRIIFSLLLITSSITAQELKLVKATKQIVNSGISSRATTNFIVSFKKEKSFKCTIDSVVNVYTQKTVPYTIIKVDNPTVLSPNYQQVKTFSKNDNGLFEITFSAAKSRGSGRPGTPMNLQVPVNDFIQGAIIYYRVGKNKKQLVVDSFEQLETLNAP